MRPDRPGIDVDGLISMMVLEPELIGRRIRIGLRPCRRRPRARSQPKYRKQPHAKEPGGRHDFGFPEIDLTRRANHLQNCMIAEFAERP